MTSERAIEVEINFLKEQIDEIKEELKELRKENKEILRFVHEAQGGKKYLAFILTTAVGLGVLIDQLIRYIRV